MVRARLDPRAFLLSIGLAMVALPGSARADPQARLVRCGNETCLRISGHRPSAGIIVRIAGRELPIEGNRSWRTTVPLAIARGWSNVSGEALTLSLTDPRSGTEQVDSVALPPGALGRRIELATLIVSAH